MTDNEKELERLVSFSLEIAQNMLDEYGLVIPFGARAYADSDEVKMQCFQEKEPDADWDALIQKTVEELQKSVANENISATAVVLSVESDTTTGVGLQIETAQAPALFVYPYRKQQDNWVIDEPTQASMLIAPKVFT